MNKRLWNLALLAFAFGISAPAINAAEHNSDDSGEKRQHRNSLDGLNLDEVKEKYTSKKLELQQEKAAEVHALQEEIDKIKKEKAAELEAATKQAEEEKAAALATAQKEAAAALEAAKQEAEEAAKEREAKTTELREELAQVKAAHATEPAEQKDVTQDADEQHQETVEVEKKEEEATTPAPATTATSTTTTTTTTSTIATSPAQTENTMDALFTTIAPSSSNDNGEASENNNGDDFGAGVGNGEEAPATTADLTATTDTTSTTTTSSWWSNKLAVFGTALFGGDSDEEGEDEGEAIKLQKLIGFILNPKSEEEKQKALEELEALLVDKSAANKANRAMIRNAMLIVAQSKEEKEESDNNAKDSFEAFGKALTIFKNNDADGNASDHEFDALDFGSAQTKWGNEGTEWSGSDVPFPGGKKQLTLQ